MKRRILPLVLLALVSVGLTAPAGANHASKRCTVGAHNPVHPVTVVLDNLPGQVPDVDLGLGGGRVQLGVACHTSNR